MMNRRGFLGLLGIGAAAAAVAPLLPEIEDEPRKKLWAVPSSAPVGSRIERYEFPVQLFHEHGQTYDVSDTAFSLNEPRGLSRFAGSFKERYGQFIIPSREDSIANLERLASAARGEIPPPVLISAETYEMWRRG